MKLLFISTHIFQTNGYSKVAYELLKSLSETKHNVVHFGYQKSNSHNLVNCRKLPGNIKIIDVSSIFPNDTLNFGYDCIESVIETEDPDIIFIYNFFRNLLCSSIHRDAVSYRGMVQKLKKTVLDSS